MRPLRAGAPRRWWSAVVLAALFAPAPLLAPGQAGAAEGAIASTTYLRTYQRENGAGGGKDRFLPLYEYLSGDATQLSGSLPLSFHFAGWGRIDLGEESRNGRTGGDFDAAFLDWRHPSGGAEARLGRFFVSEGAAADVVDGLFVKGRSAAGLGGSLLLGKPVEQGLAVRTGKSIGGARVFYARPGFAELGASVLQESGDFPKNGGEPADRKTVGGDLWVRPGGPIEFTGEATYNLSTKGFARQRYAARVTPGADMDVLLGYEAYNYADLFQPAINPAFRTRLPSFDNNDTARVVFATVGWQLVKGLTLEGGLRNIRHDAADPGSGNRADMGLRWSWNDRKDMLGASAAVQTADRDRDEYTEYRLFWTWTPASLRFALDLLAQNYKQPFSDLSPRKDAYQATAAAGWRIRPDLSLSGDVTYTRSPRFDEDYAGLAKVAWTFAAGTGGGK